MALRRTAEWSTEGAGMHCDSDLGLYPTGNKVSHTPCLGDEESPMMALVSDSPKYIVSILASILRHPPAAAAKYVNDSTLKVANRSL